MARSDLRLDDLPAWMQPRRRVTDWGRWIVLGFCLIVLLPLLFRLGLPLNNEAELYQYRASEIKQIVQTGTLYSRWAPDFHHKLGSPLFNYLAPLPHYLSGYFEALTDTGPTTSVKLFLYLSIFAAGAGMYQFARQRWGAPAGIVAAAAYVLSTPLAYSLPYVSSDLGLLMALGILPWVLYSLDRLALGNANGRNIGIAAVALGLFFISDARIAVLGSAVIGASLISLNWRTDIGKGFYRPILLAIGCAAALSAFYWIPAVFERDQIHWQYIADDPNAGAISLGELLSPMPRFDLNLQNPPPDRAIGGGTLLLGILGMLAVLFKRRSPDVGEFLFVGMMAAVAALPLVYELWPSSETFQPVLPYHAVLIATFCFSVIAGQAVQWFEDHPFAPYWPAVLVGIAVFFALTSLFPPNWLPQLTEPDSREGLRTELKGYHIGSFRTGVLLPADAPVLPDSLPDLLQQVEANKFQRLITRNIASNLPANQVEQGLLYSRYIGRNPDPDQPSRNPLFSRATQPVEISYYTFNWPGWSANANGERLPVESSPEGFIQVTVPPEAVELVIWLEGTTVRNVGWIVTIIGILGLLAAQRVNSSAATPVGKRTSVTIPQKLLLQPQIGSIAFVLGLYFCMALFMSQYPDLLLPRSRLGRIEGTTATEDNFNSQSAKLIAYQLDQSHANADGKIDVVLYWQSDTVLSEDWQSEIQVLQNNQVITWQGHRHPGGIPISRWEPGRYIRDSFTIDVSESNKQGSYKLDVKLMPCDSRDLKACDDATKIGLEGQGFITSLPALQLP